MLALGMMVEIPTLFSIFSGILLLGLSLYFISKVRKLKRRIYELGEEMTKLDEDHNDNNKRIEERADAEVNQAKNECYARKHMTVLLTEELRSPVNAILGFVNTILEKEEDRKKVMSLNTVKSAANDMLEIVTDVQDFLQIEDDSAVFYNKPVVLHSLFEEIISKLKYKASHKGIELLLQYDDSMPKRFYLDEARIRQILLNIVESAITFGTKGLIKVSATASTRGDNLSEHSVRLNFLIEFTMAEQGQKNYLKDFFTLLATQEIDQLISYGSVGLSLITDKERIEAMGGEIIVRSNLKGSSVYINFPSVSVCPDNVTVEKREMPNIEKVEFKPATILIADRFMYNREIVKHFLEKWQFSYLFAEDGVETISKAEKYRPDLIFLGMQMPLIDGYEIAENLKRGSTTSRIPIIAMTSATYRTDVDRINCYCNNYLRYPFSKERLVSEVMELLSYRIVE